MSFMCKVKVKSVEESDNWWYGSCNKNDCHEEVIKFEGKYRCARCQKNYPVPQKRLSRNKFSLYSYQYKSVKLNVYMNK